MLYLLQKQGTLLYTDLLRIQKCVCGLCWNWT